MLMREEVGKGHVCGCSESDGKASLHPKSGGESAAVQAELGKGR